MEAAVFGIVALSVIIVAMAIVVVPQGKQYTVEYFGKYTKTLMPGLNFIMPLAERVGQRISVMEQVLDVPSQEVITKDNAMVRVDGVVFFQVTSVSKAAYEVANLELAVINLVMTNLRTVIGSLDLDDILSQREKINLQLLRVVDEATIPWGTKITRIEIRDIQPPEEMLRSMARVMTAERERRAVVTEAEGLREASIRKAEGEKQAMMLEAEGRKEAAFRDAEARERSAEAEAKATQVVSEAIAKGNVNAINYFVAQDYVQALKALASAPSQKVLMMPVEASNILGALGGIAELSKEAMAAQKQTKATTRIPEAG
ncbi:MAG: SPFH/Band 7/PHB domain protein [Alphaproteobacteria bacterium]|nr:SPFH/Band 7/PHB domain protein [Alphaproteobacteria bacterium]NDC56341.1 SPFH/Band 7/PHB domain protein [Alphaproteobacteria bacterium]NDG04744.1 SPFH/Band 7/PHB domain protein [Alphaproteobacteria bacterium]